MENDKWYRLFNDELVDLPQRIEKLKSNCWAMIIPCLFCIALGVFLIGVGIPSIGFLFTIFGVTGMMAIATMCHSQLCMYRTIKELRSLKAHDSNDVNRE